jgi:hypothetical protein
MRQKRIDPEQRAELIASKPAAAIEGLRPFTAKQGQYLAFIYYYSKIHGTPPAEARIVYASVCAQVTAAAVMVAGSKTRARAAAANWS